MKLGFVKLVGGASLVVIAARGAGGGLPGEKEQINKQTLNAPGERGIIKAYRKAGYKRHIG